MSMATPSGGLQEGMFNHDEQHHHIGCVVFTRLAPHLQQGKDGQDAYRYQGYDSTGLHGL
jgi:hypothetical protein